MLYTFVAAALAFSAPASMVQSNAVVVRSSPVAMSTQYSVGRTGAFGAADKKKNPKTGSSTNLKGYTVGSRAPPMAVSSGTTIFQQYGKTKCVTLTIEPQDPTSSFCCSVTVVHTASARAPVPSVDTQMPRMATSARLPTRSAVSRAPSRWSPSRSPSPWPPSLASSKLHPCQTERRHRGSSIHGLLEGEAAIGQIRGQPARSVRGRACG